MNGENKMCLEWQMGNSTLFLIFSLWAVRKLIWSVSGKFSQVHKGDKIGFKKPILYPAWTWENFHEHFISVWAHPQRENIKNRLLYFIFVGICVYMINKITGLRLLKLWMPLISRSSTENSRPLGLLFSHNPHYRYPQFPRVPLKIAGRRPAIFQ